MLDTFGCADRMVALAMAVREWRTVGVYTLWIAVSLMDIHGKLGAKGAVYCRNNCEDRRRILMIFYETRVYR